MYVQNLQKYYKKIIKKFLIFNIYNFFYILIKRFLKYIISINNSFYIHVKLHLSKIGMLYFILIIQYKYFEEISMLVNFKTHLIQIFEKH